MTPQYQTIQNGTDTGDCFRCCIASILDLPASEVPHFHGATKPGNQLNGAMKWALNVWMRTRGYCYVEIAYNVPAKTLMDMLQEHMPDLSHVLIGTDRSNFVHAVVARNGKVIHDPATGSSGMEKTLLGPCPDGYFRVGIIALAN